MNMTAAQQTKVDETIRIITKSRIERGCFLCVKAFVFCTTQRREMVMVKKLRTGLIRLYGIVFFLATFSFGICLRGLSVFS